jgi:signal transduction histidine kinase
MEVAEDALVSDRVTASAALDRGRVAADRMSREIDDWLTYNVAREGAVQPEPVALQPVLDSIVATYPVGEFLVEAPDTVRADPTLLRHLLVNLVGNAVKYTRDGGHVAVTLEESGRTVVLTCADDGIGISTTDQAHVFEDFYRSADPAASDRSGTGLGLAIVRRIVDRYGGRIELESALDLGSTFRVFLPVARVS